MRVSVWIAFLFVGIVSWSTMHVVSCGGGQTEPTPEPSTQEPTPDTSDGGVQDTITADTTKDAGGEHPIKDDAAPDPGTGTDAGPDNVVQPEPNPNVGKIRWSASLSGVVRSVALSADEQTLYVSANGFTAFNATTGDELWRASNLGSELSSPVVGADGTIYVGSNDKKFYALSPKDKNVDWNVVLPEPAHFYAPALSKDGIIYVVAGNTLYAYKGRGEDAWGTNYVVSSGIVSAPVVGGDGTIYLCAKDGGLHAIGSDGKLKWEKSLGTEPCKAPSIDADGTIYASGERLFAYAPDGTLKWSENQYGTVTTSVVIDQAFLYFGTFTGKLYKAKRSDGKPANILWESGVVLAVTGSQDYAPTIGSGGLIYVGTGGTSPSLKAISPANGKGLFNLSASRNEYSGHAAIAKDGTLYIGNSQGTLFAVWTDSLGLANSPWPRSHHDNQNSGRFQ